MMLPSIHSHDLDPRKLPTNKAEVSSGCLRKAILILPLRLPASLWHGSVFGRMISRRPFNLQTKGFLPSYGKDRPFHSERLKRDLSSEFKVIAPNCLAMLIFNILSHNSSKTGYAHLRAKVHFFLSSTFSKNKRASKPIKSPWKTMDAKGALHLPFA